MCSPAIAFGLVSAVGSLAQSSAANDQADAAQAHADQKFKLDYAEQERERRDIGYAGTDAAAKLARHNRQDTAAVVAAASETGLNPGATTMSLIRASGSVAALRMATLGRNIDIDFERNAYGFKTLGLNKAGTDRNIADSRPTFIGTALRAVVAGGKGYALGNSTGSQLDTSTAAPGFNYITDASAIGGPNA